MEYKVIDQYNFTYYKGDLDSCMDYYYTYKILWRKEGKLLKVKKEGLDG